MAIELHDGDGSPLWQESMFVAWYDRERGIGGAHRVGHETTAGMCNLWSAVFTADGRRWRQDRDGLPLEPADRTKQRMAAGGTAFVSGDSYGLGVEVRNDGVDVGVDLTFEGFYEAMPVWNNPEAEEASSHGPSRSTSFRTSRPTGCPTEAARWPGSSWTARHSPCGAPSSTARSSGRRAS
jgi:hypothetical protein